MTEIYYNGMISTGAGYDVTAMSVEDGKITGIGSLEEVKEACRILPEAELLWHDLAGHFVVPGFIDSHMHLLNYGYSLQLVDLTEHTGSMEEILETFSTWIRERKPEPGTWIVGRGWNHDCFQDVNRFPNRFDLDRITSDYPVLAIRACGHIACANTKALEAAGIKGETAQPEGGCFDLGADGRPDGIFREYGVEMMKEAIPAPGKEQIKEYLVTGMKHLNRYGITSVHSDDFSAFAGVPFDTVIAAYEELEAEGRMTVKVYEQCLLPTERLLGEFLAKGLRTGVGSDYYRIGPLKLLTDGSLGARTAYLSKDYEDGEAGQRGIAIYSQEELDRLVLLADRGGMQIAAHAIGDGAMEMVIASIEKAERENPYRPDRRHGIVHCQITTKKLFEEFRRLKLHAYVQTIFLDYDSRIVESRVGKERAADTYRYKSLKTLGLDVSNGSDCPVEKPDVLAGIQCAVTRSSLDGSRTFLEEEAFTVEEALESYAYMGAKASFEEKKKGRLLPGMAADFTILEEDIRVVEPNRIKDTAVLAAYVDGNQVYQR